jgi:hypothetical protein
VQARARKKGKSRGKGRRRRRRNDGATHWLVACWNAPHANFPCSPMRPPQDARTRCPPLHIELEFHARLRVCGAPRTHTRARTRSHDWQARAHARMRACSPIHTSRIVPHLRLEPHDAVSHCRCSPDGARVTRRFKIAHFVTSTNYHSRSDPPRSHPFHVFPFTFSLH